MVKVHGRTIAVMLVLACAARAWGYDAAYEGEIRDFVHGNFDAKNCGMVVGIVDAEGSRVYAAGKLDNGTDAPVDGDTVFEIGSITKTFTALLLMDMADRGMVRLDDPVAKYLPEGVAVPQRDGKGITLQHLAEQSSGLPFNATNFLLADQGKSFAAYDVPDLYEFLAHYELRQEPGEKFQYSNVGMGLLGHVLERRSGESFEKMVVERICRPLGMGSTRVVLTEQMQTRLAIGHLKDKPAENVTFKVLAGAGALRSTANDLLKYVAANVGLTQSRLSPLMEKMQVIRHRDSSFEFGNTATPWMDQSVYCPDGQLLGHGGGTLGYSTFVGFDRKNQRGVVVLINRFGDVHGLTVGWRILQHARLQGLSAEEVQPVRQISGGIGAALEIDAATEELKIRQVLPKSPAMESKLAAGMIVRKIDEVATKGKTVLDCQKLIRGETGTVVKLLVAANGAENEIDVRRGTFLINE